MIARAGTTRTRCSPTAIVPVFGSAPTPTVTKVTLRLVKSDLLIRASQEQNDDRCHDAGGKQTEAGKMSSFAYYPGAFAISWRDVVAAWAVCTTIALVCFGA